MNVIISGMKGGKMSSLDEPNAKIEFLDDPETVNNKIYNALCKEGNI